MKGPIEVQRFLSHCIFALNRSENCIIKLLRIIISNEFSVLFFEEANTLIDPVIIKKCLYFLRSWKFVCFFRVSKSHN